MMRDDFLLRRDFLVVSGITAMSVVGCGNNAEDGFTPIFNGKDLSGWEGDANLWSVEDGVLIGRSPGLDYNDFLATEKTYGDFILRFKILLLNNIGNTGVQFRSKRMEGSTEMIGYQADGGPPLLPDYPNIWGNLYDESRRRVILAGSSKELLDQILKINDWNDYEIYANGDRIRLSINGETTVDYIEEDQSIARTGTFATQLHSGPPLEVRFKDIRIKEL